MFGSGWLFYPNCLVYTRVPQHKRRGLAAPKRRSISQRVMCAAETRPRKPRSCCFCGLHVFLRLVCTLAQHTLDTPCMQRERAPGHPGQAGSVFPTVSRAPLSPAALFPMYSAINRDYVLALRILRENARERKVPWRRLVAHRGP